MKKFNYLDTIISPNITEKSTSLSEFNKVVFRVHKGASKETIKRNVEKIFKVNVIKVNTINLKGKTKLVQGKKSSKCQTKSSKKSGKKSGNKNQVKKSRK